LAASLPAHERHRFRRAAAAAGGKRLSPLLRRRRALAHSTSTLHWALGLAALVPFLVHFLHERTRRDRDHHPH